MIRTYASMPISKTAWEEIYQKLKAANYNHCFVIKPNTDGIVEKLDMGEIAFVVEPEPAPEYVPGKEIDVATSPTLTERIFTRLKKNCDNVEFKLGARMQETDKGWVETMMIYCKDIKAARELRTELIKSLELLDFYINQVEDTGKIRYVR